MFESILETQAYPDLSANKTGTLNTLAIGATAVVGVGTLFTTEYVVGNLIASDDINGRKHYHTISVITDNTNLTFDNE